MHVLTVTESALSVELLATYVLLYIGVENSYNMFVKGQMDFFLRNL